VDDAVLISSTSDRADGWQVVVQLEEDDWILANAIINLSFVFPLEDVLTHAFDDCQGMCNFFVLGHRCSQNGRITSIPKQACPPFPGQLEGFFDCWSVDQCHAIFQGIRHIVRNIQRLLCRIAQSQGDFSNGNARLQLPRHIWFYIKSQFEEQGIAAAVNHTVRFCQPRPILGWGLTYHCIRETGNLEVLRFDTRAKIEAFRNVFGRISGYGVRKKRPRYNEGRAMLNINDVINVVRFPLDDEVDDGRQDQSADGIFQRYGVVEDGIDLVFDANDGVLQVVVRYQKMVVTKESMPFLSAVGVLFRGGDDYEFRRDNNINSAATPDTSTCISTGMEFMDRGYLMRVTAVANDIVYARGTYKLVGHRSARVYGCDNDHIVTYTDITDINNRIQEMLADE
jgi:hypothetical protein